MDAHRETIIKVILSGPEVIRALKAAYPHDISIQALPLNASARGVDLVMNVVGTTGLTIVYKKLTNLPSPCPVELLDHDPA